MLWKERIYLIHTCTVWLLEYLSCIQKRRYSLWDPCACIHTACMGKRVSKKTQRDTLRLSVSVSHTLTALSRNSAVHKNFCDHAVISTGTANCRPATTCRATLPTLCVTDPTYQHTLSATYVSSSSQHTSLSFL